MLEDKLSQDQRIRLEALKQATVVSAHTMPSVDQIIAKATAFESYIRGYGKS